MSCGFIPWAHAKELLQTRTKYVKRSSIQGNQKNGIISSSRNKTALTLSLEGVDRTVHKTKGPDAKQKAGFYFCLYYCSN